MYAPAALLPIDIRLANPLFTGPAANDPWSLVDDLRGECLSI
jgi:hypothetical protein